ncbi:MAG: molybdopterin-dependent oxidoreductase [Saprospiraceae bacterium]|nr:molybdopterin-dependent oxidoreductase [Saprospiraceae bacterium]
MKPLETHKSTCSYCGVGCGVVVDKYANGKVGVSGDEASPVNMGMLCSKGMNLHYTVMDQSDRLTHPQMRWSKGHPMQRVSWDQALDRTAMIFKKTIEEHGPESVAFYVSGQCLTEEYYIINKLMKGFIGSNNIDTNSRLCMSSAVVGYKDTVGEDAVPLSYADIELADTFLVAGANPAWCHPILWRRVEKLKELKPNTKIIVVDPRVTNSVAMADYHLQITPGTDVVLYNAINRLLIEMGAADYKFIDQHTEGFAGYKAKIFETSLRQAAEICGVELQMIIDVAMTIARSNGFISMWAMGLNQSSVGVEKNYALLNISLITGKIGKQGNGPFSLTGQPNAMGGREVGGLSTMLAARRNLNSEADRLEMEKFWGGGPISPKPGFTATEIIDKIHEGVIKALWVVCTNPLVSLPDLNKVESAFRKLRFCVVQEISNRSDTTKFADVLLPAAAWAEKAGTMTNSERRVSYLPKIFDAPGEALADAEIIWRFAQKMDFPGFDYTDVSQIYDEYAHLTRGTNIDVSGLSHQILAKNGSRQWPVKSGETEGTARLFTDLKFYTPSGKAIFNVPKTPKEAYTVTSPDHPLILTTGRIRDQWHTMTKTGKVNKLRSHISTPTLDIHPDDAKLRQLKTNEICVVRSSRGEVKCKVNVTTDVKKGVVFLPMHWGKVMGRDSLRTNNLTQDALDPKSKQPELKFMAVDVVKYKKPFEKVIVVGGGAAAFRFTQSYREHNQEDEILVFSKEEHAFYNRVLLPEYLNGQLSWEQLKKIKESKVKEQGIQLLAGLSIAHIDKVHKVVVDQFGKEYSYDKLVLATGSSPFVPQEVPMHFKGIFTMRSRPDADRLRAHLDASGLPAENQQVLIVGGGLLGLEVASSLSDLGVKVHIVQRNSRLMERQLDEIGSKILAQHVIEKGIQIYFDDEVYTVIEKGGHQLTVNLKSGKSLNCEAVIYAIGTRPNVELAKEAGLNVKRGVVVNEFLQTSDDSIYALGEIAEFNNRLYGITAAAEEQADLLANFMNGDHSTPYAGSILMNILKFHDLDLCSVGDIEIDQKDERYEEVVFQDLAQRYYKKVFIYDERMIGAILIGDKNEFAEYKSMIQNRIELSDRRNSLLRDKNDKAEVKGKLVCSCNQVGRGNLEDAVLQQGCNTLSELCACTGAGLGCGSCKPEVKEILDSVLENSLLLAVK